MEKITAEKYRNLFKARAMGELECMECTKNLYKLLETLYFKGIKILDLPCGVGHYYRKLREIGDICYLGADLDSKAIKMAKEIWKDDRNANFEVQDVNNLTLETNSIDTVFCYNLLLHLNDYKRPLEELFRVAGKHIIIRSLFDTTASRNTFDVSEDYLEVYPSGKVHYNTYAREDVIGYLKDLGPCNVKFVEDNVVISKDLIAKQKDFLKIDKDEFAKNNNDGKETWKGLSLNYEILFIEKL